MESAINVAQYIYNKYKAIANEPIDEMKLHKLLYFAQRECIAITGEPMFYEQFEGWKYGPVCCEVRKRFTQEDGIYSNDIKEISPENAYIVNNIISQYGAFESWKLSDLSHKEISWQNSRKGMQDNTNGNNELSLDDIKKDAEKVRPYDSLWDMYYDEFETEEKELF